jgi:hypothetical protein
MDDIDNLNLKAGEAYFSRSTQRTGNSRLVSDPSASLIKRIPDHSCDGSAKPFNPVDPIPRERPVWTEPLQK